MYVVETIFFSLAFIYYLFPYQIDYFKSTCYNIYIFKFFFKEAIQSCKTNIFILFDHIQFLIYIPQMRQLSIQY